MEYTEQQKAEFVALYTRRRRRQIAVSFALVPVLLFVVLRQHRAHEPFLGASPEFAMGAVLAIVGGALIFSFRNWRCPACDRYLGRSLFQRHCPSCGVGLTA